MIAVIAVILFRSLHDEFCTCKSVVWISGEQGNLVALDDTNETVNLLKCDTIGLMITKVDNTAGRVVTN